MIKVISCAGFGNTGSSIVTDFFGEFSCIKSVGDSSFEFLLLHENDGIMDLEYALTEGHRLKSDLAIKRFLRLVDMLDSNNPMGHNYKDYFNGHFKQYAYDYLASLGVVAWKNGWWHRIDEYESLNKFSFILKREKFNNAFKKSNYGLYETDAWRPVYLPFYKEYYCHISKKEFKEKTKYFLNRLFSEMAGDGDFLLFDQLFPSNASKEYLDYFDFVKIIIVDRDPRDLYFMNKVFWGSGYIPSENVDTYAKWFIDTRSNIYQNENILHLKFEDMIFNTSYIQKQLCDFIGLDETKRDKPRTKLFLEKSILNTQVYNRFVLTNSNDNERMKADISIIENKLSNYIYNFPAIDSSFEKKEQAFLIQNIYEKANQKSNLDVFIYIKALMKVFIRKVCFMIKRIVR